MAEKLTDSDLEALLSAVGEFGARAIIILPPIPNTSQIHAGGYPKARKALEIIEEIFNGTHMDTDIVAKRNDRRTP